MNDRDKYGVEETPDPETVRTIEELEAERESAPDGVLLEAMQDVSRLIGKSADRAEYWGVDIEELAEINRSVAEMANVMLRMYDRLEAHKTVSLIDRLHMMRDVEARNDENIRKWSERHEQDAGGV